MIRNLRNSNWPLYVGLSVFMLLVMTVAACINANLSKQCHDRGGTYVPSKYPICIGGK